MVAILHARSTIRCGLRTGAQAGRSGTHTAAGIAWPWTWHWRLHIAFGASRAAPRQDGDARLPVEARCWARRLAGEAAAGLARGAAGWIGPKGPHLWLSASITGVVTLVTLVTQFL